MIVTREIALETQGNCDIVDITAQVAKHVTESKLDSGSVTVFVTGSTAGVTTIEFESGLIADFQAAWDRLSARGIPYEHDRRWGDGNGFSHVRASLLGPSLVIPFTGKQLSLGTWQQIILVDFDNRPRSRQVVVQIMGD